MVLTVDDIRNGRYNAESMTMYFEDKNSDDVDFTPEENGSFEDVDETEGNGVLRIQKLKEELKKCSGERKEYLEGWQRAKADYLNGKKRFEEEKLQTRAYAQISFIENLLPLCDSFDSAIEHGNTESGEDNVWKTGLSQIHGQLQSLLKKYDVTPIDALGKTFNPHEHEALSSQPVTDTALHDTVVTVLQKGYKQGETLIRPAKVIIGTHE